MKPDTTFYLTGFFVAFIVSLPIAVWNEGDQMSGAVFGFWELPT